MRVTWGNRADPAASIGVTFLPVDGDTADVDRATGIRLEYTVTDGRTDEEREHEYDVPLEYAPCNFGGFRPWFRCPGVVDGEACSRRVGKLYCPPRGDLYLCRHCYDLGYESSRTSGDDAKQAELRYRRIYAKIDADERRPHPNSIEAPDFPERPTGIHTKTYISLLSDLHEAREEWYDVYMTELRGLTGRTGLGVD